MGQSLRTLTLLVVLLGAGVLLGSSLAQWWQPASRPGAGSSEAYPVPGRTRIEVLNSGGVSGAARSATTVLRDLGLDVVYYGNVETFTEDPSVVLDRVGELDTARAVARALGIRTVVSEPDSNLFVDVTVRLGPEWVPGGQGAGEEGVEKPWWDLRRLLRDDGDSRGSGPRTDGGEIPPGS